MQVSESIKSFDCARVVNDLKHQLPSQAPLKDFIHHNTLHAFQNLPFKEGILQASKRYGYRVFLPLKEYRQAYQSQRINHEILDKVVKEEKGATRANVWMDSMINKSFDLPEAPRIGMLRGLWKQIYKIDLDSLVHPLLFRLLCNYLDQGVSVWNFPYANMDFVQAMRQLEMDSAVSMFRTKKGREYF